MKLLLFLTNAFFISLLISTCQKNTKNQITTDSSSDGKVIIDTLVTSRDTIVVESPLGEMPKSTETKFDTSGKDDKYKNHHGKHEAPKHNSPEQMKIDSIKKSKENKKKG